MGVLYDWYITTGNAGRLCVLPERMMKNRESLRHIKCTGIVDAVKQLKNYDCDDPYGILEPESPFRWLYEGEHLTEPEE